MNSGNPNSDLAMGKNPDRPKTFSDLQSTLSLRGGNNEDGGPLKKKVRMSSPERFELKQLIAAGVVDKSDMPEYDEESGLLPKMDSDDEDVEVELVEDEAPFLKVQIGCNF
jgi:ATP-dependent RNA helicase DHX8/PRP22